jgi:MFS family permease
MTDRSLIYLTAVVALYTLSLSVTTVFLPNYYLGIGLASNQVILLFATMFVTLGIVPILTLKFLPRHFERLMIVGLLLSILFYFLLSFERNPVILGFAQGLSYATYWPAFNLLLFRLTGIKRRGLVVAALYLVVPTLTSIIGPFLGGIFINFFQFNLLFLLAIILSLLAVVFSLKIRYAPVDYKFEIPRSRLLLLFGLIIIVYGFTDVSFIVYPLFLHALTGGFLGMGILASVLSIIFAVVSLIVGKVSKVERHRIGFVFIGLVLSSVWTLLLVFVQNAYQLIGLSLVSGVGGAFLVLIFAVYGDFFKRKQHAMLVVLWEVFLMIGRLGNLVPTSAFLNSFDFSSYFLVVGLISLISIPLFFILMRLYHRGGIKVDSAQIELIRA